LKLSLENLSVGGECQHEFQAFKKQVKTYLQERSVMSTNYIEAASVVGGEIPAVADEKLSSTAVETAVETATVASPETANTAVEEQPAANHSTPHIAQDEKAIVEEEIRPGESGRVRFQSSWWPARSNQEITFSPGEAVRVISIDNITLIVEEG
jgi:membrane protein implicated in regulation of membrane protease activity